MGRALKGALKLSYTRLKLMTVGMRAHLDHRQTPWHTWASAVTTPRCNLLQLGRCRVSTSPEQTSSAFGLLSAAASQLQGESGGRRDFASKSAGSSSSPPSAQVGA